MTAWPLIWSPAPANPNWEGTVGDSLSFSVSAIPDPSFPDGWDYGDPETGTTNPLPPQPTNINVTLVDTDLNDEEYYSIFSDGATVSVPDVVVFLPFDSIKFEKDEQMHTVHYEQDLRDFGFDFVFEFIPYQEPFDTRYITLQATSTWSGTLTGTFIFQINNDFDAVRTALKQITQESRAYLSQVEEGDGTPDDFDDAPENTETITKPVFDSGYKTPEERNDFPDEEEQEIDSYVRQGNMDEVNERIGDGSGLTKTVKSNTNTNNNLSDNPSDDELENWFDNLGDNNG